MTKRTPIARAIDLAIGTTLAAALTAAIATTAMAQDRASSRQDFCVIGSVSIPQACPSTLNPALESRDGYMAIHMDNQKKDSAVAALWRAITFDETVVGSVSARAGQTADSR
jgi:hypothetical protein